MSEEDNQKEIDAKISKLPPGMIVELEHMVYLAKECRARPESKWPMPDGSEIPALVFLAMLEREMHDILWKDEMMNEIIKDIYGSN